MRTRNSAWIVALPALLACGSTFEAGKDDGSDGGASDFQYSHVDVPGGKRHHAIPLVYRVRGDRSKGLKNNPGML